MSVSVLLSGTLKDGLVEQFTEICSEAFHVTRAFDGCQNINLTLHVEDPHKFVLTEVWSSKEHYDKYAAFRAEDGTVGAIGDMCADGPNVDIFDITDA